MNQYDLKITLRSPYILNLWDSPASAGSSKVRRMTGAKAAHGLFSLAAFASNKRPEYRLDQALAKLVLPMVDKMLSKAESELSRNLRQVKLNAAKTVLPAIEVSTATSQPQDVYVPEGEGGPLIARFARLFAIADNITAELWALHQHGCIDFKSYKRQEKALIAPLRKTMENMAQLVTQFHQKRKALSAKNRTQSAAIEAPENAPESNTPTCSTVSERPSIL